MKTGFALLLPTGLLFAWSAPWACQTYANPDGGTTNVNPYQDSGYGGRYSSDAGSVTTAPLPDAGLTGIIAGPDGGITVGSSALFTSDFVYASNYADGTISRVIIPPDAGIPPYEQARYAAVIPVNNHQLNVSYPWTTAGCGDQLGSNGANSPSRTIVDRKGNVVVALRAPGCQAGATRIINVGDNLSSCHIRCANRAGLMPNQHFTQGIPLTTTAGTTIELLPSTPPFTIPGAIVTAGQPVIQAGTSAATTYHCTDVGHDNTGTVDTDPVNYDDCIDFSVALGDPNPDPNADPGDLTHGTSFGRAAAISPNCAPNTNECDTWIGMWNGAAWVHLANGSTPPLQLFDVQAVDPVGIGGIYGGTVDCAGVLWGTYGLCSTSVLSAVTTVPLNDPTYGIEVPADTVITTVTDSSGTHSGVPNLSSCGGYGIASDTADRIWVAGCGNSYTCSFNASQFLGAYSYFLDAGSAASSAVISTALSQAWQSYDWNAVGMGGRGRGINVDKYNNVYQGFDSQNAAAASLNPDPDGGVGVVGTGFIPCTRSGGGTCVDRYGNPTPSGGVLNWTHVEPSNVHGNNTIGVDLDAEGNLWLGQYSADSAGHATAVQLNGQNGAFMNSVEVGSGLYSYSDFTGYALREITLSSATYEQSIPACGGMAVSPELTEWTALNFQVWLPTGTDIRLAVSVTNATDPATLAASPTYVVCPSLASGTCTTLDANGNGAISLAPLSLPQGAYLNVFATLVPRICAIGGGGLAQGKPVLYSVGASDVCSGD